MRLKHFRQCWSQRTVTGGHTVGHDSFGRMLRVLVV